MSATVRRSPEVLVGARGEEIGVEEQNGVAEYEIGLQCGLVKRAQELLPHGNGKRLDLQRVRRILIRRVGCPGPLQVLMQDPVDGLVNDEALIEIVLRKPFIGRALDEQGDIGELRDEDFILLDVEQAKDGAAEGMADLAHDLYMHRPARAYPAAAQQPNGVASRA